MTLPLSLRLFAACAAAALLFASPAPAAKSLVVTSPTNGQIFYNGPVNGQGGPINGPGRGMAQNPLLPAYVGIGMKNGVLHERETIFGKGALNHVAIVDEGRRARKLAVERK